MVTQNNDKKWLRATHKSNQLPQGILRASTLENEYHLSRHQQRNLVAAGKLRYLGRGLYSLPESPVTANHGLAIVATRVPHGVICLSSALQFHQLTTQNPWQVNLMLERGSRPPKLDYPPLLLVYAQGESFSAGIEQHQIEGAAVQVTCVAKTVADCFKYRNKIGLDIAMEALKEALESRKTTRTEIRQYAQICRVEKVMRPYVEMLSV